MENEKAMNFVNDQYLQGQKEKIVQEVRIFDGCSADKDIQKYLEENPNKRISMISTSAFSDGHGGKEYTAMVVFETISEGLEKQAIGKEHIGKAKISLDWMTP